jgi:lipopolysaccharide transport system permease protein
MIAHLAGVYRCRYFWGSLVRLDLRNRYRRSVLGIGWSLLQPLAMAAVFATVFSGLMGQEDWRVYVPYLITGMAVWDFIKNAATGGCESFIKAEAYTRQHPLPFSIYPIRTVLGNLIHFVIALIASMVFTAYLQNSERVFTMIPYIIAPLIMVMLFSWGIATMASFAHVYFHDTKHLIEVGSQMFFFLTPIMYLRSKLDEKQLGWLADLNPVNTYLELIRTPLLDGSPPAQHIFQQGLILCIASFGLGCGALAWLQKKIVFQL